MFVLTGTRKTHSFISQNPVSLTGTRQRWQGWLAGSAWLCGLWDLAGWLGLPSWLARPGSKPPKVKDRSSHHLAYLDPFEPS